MWGPGFKGRPAGTAHNVETKQKPSTFNKYLCTQCYIHVLYSSTQEWVWWLKVTSFAENMKLCLCYCSQMHVVVLKTSLEIHINCLFPLLDLLQSSKAIKGTRTVIGHAQVILFSSPCKHACIFVDLRYWHLQNGNATLSAEAAENEQPAAVYAWLLRDGAPQHVAPVNSWWNQKLNASKQATDSRGWGAESTKD